MLHAHTLIKPQGKHHPVKTLLSITQHHAGKLFMALMRNPVDSDT